MRGTVPVAWPRQRRAKEKGSSDGTCCVHTVGCLAHLSGSTVREHISVQGLWVCVFVVFVLFS